MKTASYSVVLNTGSSLGNMSSLIGGQIKEGFSLERFLIVSSFFFGCKGTMGEEDICVLSRYNNYVHLAIEERML